MSERLTDEQLRGYASAEYSLPFAHAMADELLALRAKVAKLEAALERVHPHICAFGSDEELAVIDAALSETVEA